MKFGKYFEYNGRSSEEFGVILASFGDKQDLNSGLSRSIIKGNTTRFRKRGNHIGTEYNDALEFSMTIIKNKCYTNDLSFSRREIREINAWLTSPTYPILFHMFDDKSNDEDIDYFGLFSDVEYEAAGDLIGLTLTFTCDSPFGYSPLVKRTLSKSEQIQTINIESDELEDYVYPYLEIEALDDTDVLIKNHTTGQEVEYMGIKKGKVLCVDNEKLIVNYKDDPQLLALHILGIRDIGEVSWIRFVSGLNKIEYIGDAKIKMSYRQIRKVGAY